jgi:hypothetical protein
VTRKVCKDRAPLDTSGLHTLDKCLATFLGDSSENLRGWEGGKLQSVAQKLLLNVPTETSSERRVPSLLIVPGPPAKDETWRARLPLVQEQDGLLSLSSASTVNCIVVICESHPSDSI